MGAPIQHDNAEECVEAVLRAVGPSVRLAIPLGIGKPVHFVNALYDRARRDASISLEIYTGLSLERPSPSHPLERRLLEPMMERLFGDSPPLAYAEALAAGTLPPNVRVHEFFFQPGTRLTQADAQQDYISSNYTHVARDTAERGINLIAHLVSLPRGGRYSLGSNPDVTLDILPLLQARGEAPVMVAEVGSSLPFMGGDAVMPEEQFGHVLGPVDYEPFTVPHRPVDAATYAAALHTSTLIRDGGTLQVGIGAFADALTATLLLRHRDPQKYANVLADLGYEGPVPEPFENGLYAASEMLVDGFLDLMAAGILKRPAYDHAALQLLANDGTLGSKPTEETLERLWATGLWPAMPRAADIEALKRHGILRADVELRDGRLETSSGQGASARFDTAAARREIAATCLGTGITGGPVVHSGFFVGSRGFREKLRALSEAGRGHIGMTGIHFVNSLHGDETLKRLQRRDAVFINNAMMVTLTGAAVSDGLEDGRVVSGVGGQYNFVEMAHALDDGRSVIVLPATRTKDGRRRSNIVVRYGHVTIPRHLRDIVVTEYGIASLRGRTDGECIAEMLRIADSEFQAALFEDAAKAGKIPPDWRLPEAARRNTPARLEAVIASHRQGDDFHAYPLGSELTETERALADALQWLQRENAGWRGKLRLALGAFLRGRPHEGFDGYLKRMKLVAPRSLRERFYRRLLVVALKATIAA